MSKKENMFDSSTDLDSEDLALIPKIVEAKKDFEEFLAKPHWLLVVLGNVALIACTGPIAHAIYFIGCLINRGTDFQKWEDYDPITWFFKQVTAVPSKSTEKAVDEDAGYESAQSVEAGL